MVRVRSMVFNAHFNDGSVISWRSVLLVEETGGFREVTEQDSNSRTECICCELPYDDDQDGPALRGVLDTTLCDKICQ